ncbi:ABC transporter permease subunit/CPBP intramembrane protease [Calycomorphotria hydatis]|uniref:ABC-2 family transporter protein n=1 Tax=Calycomorphotria hydatis TaxID=2528027 RepID=A0A517TDT9_9PLAN|nr:ABC transporter permease subunit/CPBP intramembrane protease [Calycomorphotria hydatis]QDT66540.1 ABC-2 family transporter protein [Calycomorphotria hydatis]
MNWNNVKLIFMREIRDQLRDRRTIFMIVVMPLLLYPAIGIGMVQMMVLFTEQPRTVVVLNEKDLPQPSFIEGDRIRSEWFDAPGDASKLEIISETTRAAAESDETQQREAKLLKTAQRILDAHLDYLATEKRLASLPAEDESKRRSLTNDLNAAADQRKELFAHSGIDVLIAFPEGLAEQFQKVNELIKERGADTADVEFEVAQPYIVGNKAYEKSQLADIRVRRAMSNWEDALLTERLKSANLPASLPNPIDPVYVDVAMDSDRSASLWSKLFPALLVLMTVTGAFYPAVDVAAGEKERGTMETLLICPAARAEIVLGKFFTVLFFSIGTAVLNLFSMGVTGRYMASMATGGSVAGRLGSLTPPSPESLIWVVVLMVPLAALFSALCLSFATFAKSSKEGQYYLYPILLVAIGLTVFCISPGVEINPLYSILPVVGPSLLLRELLSAGNVGDALQFAPAVLITSFGYGALALWWAVDQFNSEDVLFREAERFELGLWIRHMMRDKEMTPSFAEGGFCFVLIMLMQFGALKFQQDAILGVEGSDIPVQMLRLLMVQQLVVIATPALFMGVMLTRSMKQTFRLRWPSWKFLGAAVVLPFTVMPLATTLVSWLAANELLPPPPEGAQRLMEMMGESAVPFWMAFLAFAITPGICEELAFRGFIFSGFERSKKIWLAIALSSLAFGVMHMIPQQVFNATLLGILLAWIAYRSGSIVPGIVFHILFNGSQVMLSRVAPESIETGPLSWIMSTEGGGLNYHWPVLATCAVVTVIIIRALAKSTNEQAEEVHEPVAVNGGDEPVLQDVDQKEETVVGAS